MGGVAFVCNNREGVQVLLLCFNCLCATDHAMILYSILQSRFRSFPDQRLEHRKEREKNRLSSKHACIILYLTDGVPCRVCLYQCVFDT